MTADSFTAQFQALKARHAGRQLNARQMKAMMVAEVAAAWLDRMEAGGDIPPEAATVANQLSAIIEQLETPPAL